MDRGRTAVPVQATAAAAAGTVADLKRAVKLDSTEGQQRRQQEQPQQRLQLSRRCWVHLPHVAVEVFSYCDSHKHDPQQHPLMQEKQRLPLPLPRKGRESTTII